MRLDTLLSVLREYGPGWALQRGAWSLTLRSGYYRRRLPQRPDLGSGIARGMSGAALGSAEDVHREVLEASTRFFLPADPAILRAHIGAPQQTLQAAGDLLEGRMALFGHRAHDVGRPPDWLRSPVTGRAWPGGAHWSRVPDLSAELGDIKEIWEMGRFGHAFLLARAYAVTTDETYPQAFWEDVEDWIARNPPETGPHWRCGQEISLRVLAWIFGLYAFARSPATTPERTARMLGSVRDQMRHVEVVHGYAARCLRNNHAISEATALFTVGTLFDRLPESARWRRRGLTSLERETWQVYRDGVYVQHSMNYARMVAQLYGWVLAVAGASATDPPGAIPAAARRLLRFLVGMQDRRSGALPNHGPNDTTLLLPLSACAARDFRPALNALSVLLGEGPLYGPGPWEEEAAWLAGPPERVLPRDAPSRPPQIVSSDNDDAPPLASGERPPRDFPEGGYYRLDGRETHGIIRCGPIRHRPHQADMLHLDLWFHGLNVLVDPGTFSYNAEPRWVRHFSSTAAHNTVTVDGRDQMRRGERFLWHDWTDARALRHEPSDAGGFFQGALDLPGRIRHTRTVHLREDLWVVLDDLVPPSTAEADHAARLHWLVDVPEMERYARGARLRLGAVRAPDLCLECADETGAEGTWVSGREDDPRGWTAPAYGTRRPAWSFALVSRGAPLRFATVIGPEAKVAPLLPLTPAKARELVAAWVRPARADAVAR